MNKSFRSVWNARKQTYVAAAETVSARGKPSSGVQVAAALTALLGSLLGQGAFAQTAPPPTALPTGGQVSAGQANSINARSMALNAGGSVLVGTLGRQIGLDQASISDSRALGGSTLTIGKQLSPKFFVSYGVSLLGIGQVITLKYLLQKGLDITVESEQSDQREQTSAALNWRK